MNKNLVILALIITTIIWLSRKKIKQIIMGVIIPEKLKPIIDRMVKEASNDGVNLTIGSGLRTFEQQLAIRRAYVIDKSKVNDLHYLKTAPSNKFFPLAAIPGTSNHEHGNAIDFNVTKNPDAFKWLVNNAHRFGFIRTIKSEPWHWEYKPNINKFAYVSQTDKSWKNLV